MAWWRPSKHVGDGVPADPMGPARAALRDGDAPLAVRLLRQHVRETGSPPLAELVVDLGRVAGSEHLAAAAAEVAQRPENPRSLHALGYQLFEVGLPELAVPYLARARDLAPQSGEVLLELITALDEGGEHARSRDLLVAHGGEVDGDPFLLTYLLCFEHLMVGDVASAVARRPLLPAPGDAVSQEMQDRLDRMLARAAVVDRVTTLDDTDLRGWHFVLSGGLLLATSPYGRDDGMNGRWAYLAESYADVAAGLRRAQDVLRAWGLEPACVVGLPDRGSQAVARAAATLLGVELVAWGTGRAGLMVAYDLADSGPEVWEQLGRSRAGSPLYVHATCWTRPEGPAADLTSVLYQHLVPPWGEQMRAAPGPDGLPGPVEVLPADDAPSDVLAQYVVDADPSDASWDDAEAGDVVAFATAVRHVTAGAQPSERDRVWPSGPVTSSRFEA